MRQKPASFMGVPFAPWLVPRLRHHGFGVGLAGCFLFEALATVFVGLSPDSDQIWVANGVLLAYLLVVPRRRWASYLCVGFAAQLAGFSLIYPHPLPSVLMTLFNLTEVLLTAVLLRRSSIGHPRFADSTYLVRFIAYAVVTGPLTIGSVFAVSSHLWLNTPVAAKLLQWTIADGLGAAVTTPACVAIFRARFKDSPRWGRDWIPLFLTAAISLAAFSQSKMPIAFLVYPALILVLLRLGLGWAAMATLIGAGIASLFTFHGAGPFVAANALSPLEPDILLQLFLASAMFMLYSVSVVLEHRHSVERRLAKIAVQHALVTENSRDVIILSDFNGVPRYISPGVYQMTGWKPEETMQRGFAEVAHPDDLGKIQTSANSLAAGAESAIVEFRVRKRSGGYIWVESSERLVHDPKTGAASRILSIVRDVTQRKKTEESREFHHSLNRAIFEVSLDGILLVNNEGFVVSYNKRFMDLWHAADADFCEALHYDHKPFADERLLSLVASRVMDPELFLARVRELYENPDATDQCEIRLKDGRTVERYSTSVRSESGLYLGRVWFFRDISERIIVQMKLQEAYSAVQALAATDALTGLANRRRFDEVLNSEWRRGLRDHSPLSLLMIDVDLFKSYNDTYGHTRGDSCLKQIAEAAQDVVGRPGDLVARFGGEEFAAILPNTGSEGAMRLGIEIVNAMEGRKLLHKASPAGIVTVSVGCSTILPAFGGHAVNLIELADEALYRAKRQGRNRACNADAPKESGVELISVQPIASSLGRSA